MARTTAKTTYTAICRRVGDWWAITVPELPGVHSQARRLDQVEAMARDAITLMLDVNPATIAVEVTPQPPQTVTRAVKARYAAREAERKAEEFTADAVRQLLQQNYTR